MKAGKVWGLIAAAASGVVLMATLGDTLEGCAGRVVVLQGQAPSIEAHRELEARVRSLELFHQDVETWRKFHEGLPPPEGHRHE